MRANPHMSFVTLFKAMESTAQIQQDATGADGGRTYVNTLNTIDPTGRSVMMREETETAYTVRH